MTTFYIDPVNGNDSADGSTFALGGLPTVGPWKTVAGGATAARTTPGDEIRIAKSPAPVSLGTCTFAEDSITLPSSVEYSLSTCETESWTAATDITVSLATSSPSPIIGTKSLKITPATAFTTGKMAYLDLGSTQDLSSYQKIQFWIYRYISNFDSVDIKLCSDATGDTPVNTLSLASGTTVGGEWAPVVLDNGSALSSNVRSIAIYATADPGTYYFGFRQISALTAAAPDLDMVISDQNSSEIKPWYATRYISGDTLYLRSSSGKAGKFLGTTGSKTGYSINPIKIDGARFIDTQESGTVTSPYLYRGGFDTSSDTQTGMTWIRCLRYYTNIYSDIGDYSAFENFGCVGGYHGVYVQTTLKMYFKNISLAGIGAYGIYGYGICDYVIFDGGQINGTGRIFSYAAGNSLRLDINNSLIYNSTDPSDIFWDSVVFRNCELKNLVIDQTASSYGQLYPNIPCKIKLYNCTFGNAGGSKKDIQFGSSSVGSVVELFNCLTPAGIGTSYYCQTRSIKYGQTTDDHRITTGLGVSLLSETSVRHTASGIAWKFTPTNSISYTPDSVAIATVPVAASAQVTVKVWMRRTHADLGVALCCKGYQIAGVDSDVRSSMTAAADTWEELTIQFTPTEAGVVEITAEAWGSSSYSAYIDDMTITQA